ncbi:MAG: hypothetical protein KF789_11410 [Bdellovibrionaceae bacterium]|nr:hypothetical protein [Pseudobdellovibrionaceae bacterium]
MAAAPKEKPESSLVPSEGRSEEGTLFRLDGERTDLGRADSLRYNILSWVLNERYDRAIQELREFENRPSPYPTFHARVSRYILHSIDLIFAIKAKRNFPGINSLTRAKQQELREKFKEHFKELRLILMRVEKAEADLRIEDVRSTIYVVRALWIAVVAVIVLAFSLEIMRGLAETVGLVTDDALIRVTDWMFGLIGF